MLISWIQKTTLLDYPGKVSTIIFTPWCDLRCKYCHNSQFVLPELLKDFKTYIPEEVFFNFLNTKIWILDWVVICWWEPTLQKDLVEFCEKIKKLWFLVKLDTNWRDPEILKKLLDKNLVDYIAMDVKTTEDKFQNLTWIKPDFKKYLQSIEIIKNSNIDYEFRTTVVKWYHEREDIENISKMLENAKNYNFQNYNHWNTLDKNFNWKSFTEYELKEFVQIAKKYVLNSKIRF